MAPIEIDIAVGRQDEDAAPLEPAHEVLAHETRGTRHENPAGLAETREQRLRSLLGPSLPSQGRGPCA